MWSIPKLERKRRGAGAASLFVRVAGAITDDIRRGALQPGDRLPSTRELADRLDVNRNTVVAAYDELVAQGWIVSRGAGGTFVSSDLPEKYARAVRSGSDPAPVLAARAAYDCRTVAPLRVPFGDADTRYHLSAGVPDPRLFPGAVFARAYRRALRSRSGRDALDYADPAGSLQLRTAVAAMLRANRGLAVTTANVMITRGSQQALDLAARLLVRAGDVAAVEELGYRPAWQVLEEAGARLVPVPLDKHGMVIDQLQRAPRLVYVTPHHQYPTTVLLSPARRLELLARARRERFAIIEDDYDHEFHFEGRPVAPLAAADTAGSVIYVGTLSKILAPGLRIGFVAAPERVIENLARLRAALDRQGDHVTEQAIAELIDDGELQRHARKMRRAYEARRDALVTALRRELGNALTIDLPAGGMTLWARAAPDIRVEAWRDRAVRQGVAFVTARDLSLDGKSRPFIRFAYARYDERELADAARRMKRALAA